VCLSRGEAYQGDRGGDEKEPSDAVAILSYDEKPGIRRSPTRPRTCRPSPACMPLSRGS